MTDSEKLDLILAEMQEMKNRNKGYQPASSTAGSRTD